MNAVSQLDREWSSIANNSIADALAHWQSREPLLRPFATPRQLLRFLHRSSTGQSDPLLLALLQLNDGDPFAGRLLLQAVLPALKAQSTRISHPPGRSDELWELLLFHAWQAICCYPVATRRQRVAANLVLEVLHGTTRDLRRNDPPHEAGGARFSRSLRTAAAATLDPFAVAADASGLPTGQDAEALVLAAADLGLIAEQDAELILRTRLEGVRLRLVAQVLGVSYDALRKRRQRAEDRLRQLLIAPGDVPEALVSDLISSTEKRTRAGCPHKGALALPPGAA